MLHRSWRKSIIFKNTSSYHKSQQTCLSITSWTCSNAVLTIKKKVRLKSMWKKWDKNNLTPKRLCSVKLNQRKRLLFTRYTIHPLHSESKYAKPQLFTKCFTYMMTLVDWGKKNGLNVFPHGIHAAMTPHLYPTDFVKARLQSRHA